jgi:carboxyl-terminal processing protease
MLPRFSACALLLVAVGTTAAGPVSEPAAIARRAWVVTETVLDHDVAPPTRQEMLLGGIRSLLRGAGATPPADLSRRVSTITSEQQFAALLQEFWPQTAKDTDPETSLLRGLVQPVPGGGLLTADERKVEEQVINNRYVGTGIQIRLHPQSGLTQIVTTFPGGPARKAGVRDNDLIVAVNGVDLHGARIRRVVDLIRGDEGTEVTLTVRQPDAKEPRVLKMIRSVVPFDTAIGLRRVSEENWDFHADASVPIAYIRLTSLRASTLQELRRLEGRLKKEGFRALVLDLRFGQGGEVHHAALVADGLLDGGVMWRVRDAAGRVKEYRADRDCLFRDWPIAVLVNDASGKNVGLLAAALQDNGRAPLIGEPLQFKGFVSSLVPLPDGGAVELRTGRAERARHPGAAERRDDGEVVQPDHVVRMDTSHRQRVFSWKSDQERGATPAEAQTPADPQLAKALEVLRAALQRKDAAGS